MSSIVELYLRITEKHYTKDQLKKDIEFKRKNGDTPYILPKRITKRYGFLEKQYQGMQVFSLNEEKLNDKVVLYLHGGAYYRKPRKYHLLFVGRISEETGVPFVAPIYGKTPIYTPKEVYETLTNLYNELKTKHKDVILMGDSSGGGLALGLTLYLKEQGYGLPSELILLSPWVDVSLENEEIQDYIKKDPIVFLDNVKALGKEWAGELPLDDYRVSPINGNLSGLCQTHIFCGTREVLYPDCHLLYEKLKASGINVFFYEGKGQNHVYPIYPLIKEAKKARSEIEEIIEKSPT